MIFRIVFFSLLFACPNVYSNDKDKLKYVDPKQKRQTEIRFGTGFVEGVGKSSGTYAGVTKKERKDRKPHLYRRKMIFDSEMNQVISDLRFE